MLSRAVITSALISVVSAAPCEHQNGNANIGTELQQNILLFYYSKIDNSLRKPCVFSKMLFKFIIFHMTHLVNYATAIFKLLTNIAIGIAIVTRT